jgi:hypothetical protein
MEWGRVRKLLRGFYSQDHNAAALSRREMLAGIGLAGLFVAAPNLLAMSPAEARTINTPAVEPAAPADTTSAEVTEDSAVERDAADTADVTEFSAHRRWSSRYYWRRRYWRRRYWRRRYYVRRRYWRRRYWRRRYWRRVWW